MRLKQPVVGSGFGVGSGKYSLKILAGGYCRFCHRGGAGQCSAEKPGLGAAWPGLGPWLLYELRDSGQVSCSSDFIVIIIHKPGPS